MKRAMMLAGLLVLLTVGLVPVLCQDMGGGTDGCSGMGDDSCGGKAEETKPEHATKDPNGVLAKLAGEWEFHMKLYMEPGKDPTKMDFSLKSDWALDGQFIKSEYELKEGPLAHKGVEYLGYDEATEQYNQIRLTSMSGSQIVYKGKYDADKKTLELKASYGGKMGDMKYTATSREVYAWKDDDNYTCTVYTKYDNIPDLKDEMKEVEITATRKK